MIRSVGHVSTNAHAKCRCAPLLNKKALGIFRELIAKRTTRTTKWLYETRLPGPKMLQNCLEVL